MLKVPGKLPGLDNFYMAGQWANPSGGVPVGAVTGRWSIMRICREEAGEADLRVWIVLIIASTFFYFGNVAILQELTGAEVYASEEDIPVIAGTADRKGFKKYLKYFLRVKNPKDIKPFAPGMEINGIKGWDPTLNRGTGIIQPCCSPLTKLPGFRSNGCARHTGRLLKEAALCNLIQF